ncbi:MAG: VWA domain-containing protein [Moraxellaceae bacterium]|nr:VWA domain-containing protein [Pseudobdellovibrionaceae bacterium]
MTGFRWGASENFNYLVWVIVFIAVYFIFRFRNVKRLNQAFGDRIAPYLSQSVSTSQQNIKLIFEVIGCVFLIIAMARPQLGQTQQEIKSEGIEMMIVADVSESMLAEDIKPSRLELMKVELEKLVDMLPGNKIGLIAFAGSSALMSPLTTDPGALKMYIQSLDVNSVSSQGTNFQVALSYAKESFEKGGVTQSDNLKTTRVVLVLSDGEDQEPNALDEAKKMSELGIHIITVAYGTEKGGSIPARDIYGNLNGSKKDKSGQPIITQVHGDFLKEIAEKTKGQFYTSSFGGDHLKSIVTNINEFEKEEFASSVNLQYDEKFVYPLGLGILFLCLSFIIFNRNANLSAWKGMYDN